MHHSVKPRVGTSLVVNPSLPSLSLYTCIIPHSVHEEGLFSFVRVWPCHVCAGSRRTASTRAELWMFRVTPRWHADIYRATAAFVPLSSAWQRTYRSPKKIPEQYQFAQPAHSEWRIRCTQVGHIHTHMQAHADLQRIAVECTSKGDRNTHTHTHRVSKRSNTQIGWCDNTLRREMIENYWGWHLCRPARDLNPCDYIISSKRQISSLCLWQHGCREDASTCMKHLSLSSSVSIRHQKSVRRARG